MSAYGLQSIMPDATAFLQQHTPLFDLWFPAESQLQCPQPVIVLPINVPEAVQKTLLVNSPLQIYWATLIAFELIGIVIGLLGALLLFPKRFWIWRLAFLFFACMNFDAIFVHNILKLYSAPWQFVASLDVGFTSASSFCLVIASVIHPQLKNSQVVQPIAVFTAGLALVAAAVYGNDHHIPWTGEVLYAGMTAVAAVMIFNNIVLPKWSKTSSLGKFWLFVLTIGGIFCLIGFPLDRHLCTYFGSHFNFIHLLFLGCDLGFIGLAGFLVIEAQTTKKSKTS